VRPLPRRSFGFPALRRSNDRRSLIRSRRGRSPGPDPPTSSPGPPRRVPAPGEGAGSLLRPPSGRRSLPVGPVKWRLLDHSGRGRVLDRALPEITDSRSSLRPLSCRQHPRRWLPLSDAPCRLQRVRRARARSKLRHWTNARHRPISNCSSVKLDNNTRKVLTGHNPLEHNGTSSTGDGGLCPAHSRSRSMKRH
jgi:hypothetical protein